MTSAIVPTARAIGSTAATTRHGTTTVAVSTASTTRTKTITDAFGVSTSFCKTTVVTHARTIQLHLSCGEQKLVKLSRTMFLLLVGDPTTDGGSASHEKALPHTREAARHPHNSSLAACSLGSHHGLKHGQGRLHLGRLLLRLPCAARRLASKGSFPLLRGGSTARRCMDQHGLLPLHDLAVQRLVPHCLCLPP